MFPKILAASCLALLALGCSKKSADDVPVIAELPEFSLVDQDEHAFNRESMEGDIWMTAFVFTHCRATCPRLTAQMKKLQGRLSDVPRAHFLSVSVDPRNDTPEVIKAYMTTNGIDEANWRFVTGREEAIQNFVVGGFKTGYGRTKWAPELTHSNSFALVDERARIRGYYGSDDEGIADLERDLRALAPQGGDRVLNDAYRSNG
ncbi:MAG: SCO family protein [Deltaproteobacteria bacterium]|nr:SCO family protein [Deltaproteobacteria bacterium]